MIQDNHIDIVTQMQCIIPCTTTLLSRQRAQVYRRAGGENNVRLPFEKRAGRGITTVWQEPARFEGITVRDYLSLGKRGSDLSDCLNSVGLGSEP